MAEAGFDTKGQDGSRELPIDAFLIAEGLSTGNEVHAVVMTGLTATDGALPKVVGARFDQRFERVILEFDRPVPDQIIFQSVPPL